MASKIPKTRTNKATSSVEETAAPPRLRRRYARWRAFTLSLVYVAFAAHIIHWKLTGRTLAPLELNEVMYTLELGIITAGFLFMCALVLGTAIFGRFFCSWTCHIMVLQDLCAWLLRKIGIRAKPIRSRLLLLVPPLTAFYMFLWPQIVRTYESKTLPSFHLATDADGWASLVTNNFWRNLPSAPIIAITFLVCGFLIVYVLGSRTFCTYVCPYGAVFALADRVAPGRIRVTDACQQCGRCTAACTSGVRVHEEVHKHGMIVNPACLKDLDCIETCPQHALYYGFTKPALWKSRTTGGRFGLPYDFTLVEDLLMSTVFVVVLVSFRGLYSRVPFLLSLALGCTIGYVAVLSVRLLARPNVSLASFRLKALGRITPTGRAFSAGMVLLAAFVAHSGFVRYHEYCGLKETRALAAISNAEENKALAARAYTHLQTAQRWGLLTNDRVERSLLTASYRAGLFDAYVSLVRPFLTRFPNDLSTRLQLGQALLMSDRKEDAEQEFRAIAESTMATDEHDQTIVAAAFHGLGELAAGRGEFHRAGQALRRAVELDPDQAPAHAELGGVLAELGRMDDAVASLREAVRLDPAPGGPQYNLGTLLSHQGRFADAIVHYEQALATMADDADLQNNLGFALVRIGDLERAKEHLERAIQLNHDHAGAHFNLAVLLRSQGRQNAADAHISTAARLDPRYAGF